MTTDTVTPLAPEVLDRLHLLQNQDRPISVDEILVAANLNHLTTTTSSSSSTLQLVSNNNNNNNLEKSVSTSTLAERRRLPISPEKLKLYAQINNNNNHHYQREQEQQQDESVLKRLEEENAKLPPQDSEEYMLAHIERQNALLNADPKSICIESNRLQADFTTIRNLVTDATFSPTTQQQDYEETIQALLTNATLKTSNEFEYKQADWDFWQTIVQDYPAAVAKLPHLLTAKLRCGGIPHQIRGVIWQSMAQSSSLNLESLYQRLCQETSSYERVIQRDLSRTFPQLDMFKADGGEGQLAMGRLLKAYSLYDAHVGYCQGLAFLVGPLLMTMPENQAFCVFVRLMETYEMRTMFTLNMEGLHLRLHQFQVLLSQLCPQLDAHLQHHSIHTAMYASQWYLTLFAYSFPISLVLRIWDLVFAEGAVETITRVAIAIMQKNEQILLAMGDFEQLMMYLSSRKLYEIAYDSDPEAVIADTMALSAIITKQKMDSISENYHYEIEQEKTRAQQVLAIRFGSGASGGNKSPTTSKKNKRESWFPWSQQNIVTTPASLEEQQERRDSGSSSSSNSSSSIEKQQQQQQDRTIPLLHQQIEDLVTALSHLQKENRQISEDLMAKQMREMDLLTERDLLLQINANLEKSHLVVQQQLSPVESVDGDDCCSNNDSTATAAVVVEEEEQQQENKLRVLQKQVEFRGFVDSLKMSGDFGALIAGALSTSNSTSTEGGAVKEVDIVSSSTHVSTTPTENNNNGLDEVTSELVSIKLANFEMGLKYQTLCQEHEQVLKTLKVTTEGQTALTNKIISLQTVVESLQIDKEQLLEERDQFIQESETLVEKTLASKKTCADLQLEKLHLEQDLQDVNKRVKALEDQRREYLMPRGSFTEEVFAAHETLFPNHNNQQRRHTLTSLPKQQQDEYKTKYIESDLRCREMEKLLAETKFKLVEYEAAAQGGYSNASSPRASLQQNRRPNSVGGAATKRSSLSMLVKVNTTTTLHGGGGPQSPPFTTTTDSRRESTESTRSTTSSTTAQKRSSVYSRFVNALGGTTGPLTEEEVQELSEEAIATN